MEKIEIIRYIFMYYIPNEVLHCIFEFLSPSEVQFPCSAVSRDFYNNITEYEAHKGEGEAYKAWKRSFKLFTKETPHNMIKFSPREEKISLYSFCLSSIREAQPGKKYIQLQEDYDQLELYLSKYSPTPRLFFTRHLINSQIKQPKNALKEWLLSNDLFSSFESLLSSKEQEISPEHEPKKLEKKFDIWIRRNPPQNSAPSTNQNGLSKKEENYFSSITRLFFNSDKDINIRIINDTILTRSKRFFKKLRQLPEEKKQEFYNLLRPYYPQIENIVNHNFGWGRFFNLNTIIGNQHTSLILDFGPYFFLESTGFFKEVEQCPTTYSWVKKLEIRGAFIAGVTNEENSPWIKRIFPNLNKLILNQHEDSRTAFQTHSEYKYYAPGGEGHPMFLAMYHNPLYATSWGPQKMLEWKKRKRDFLPYDPFLESKSSTLEEKDLPTDNT